MQADFPEIILASASAARAAILGNAGVRFHQRPSTLDESEATGQLADGASPEAVALHLASLKADLVLKMEPDAIVIGADQVLSIGDEILQKPGTQAEARLQLEKLRGRTHQLHSAVIVLHKGQARSFVDTATLTMRDFSGEFLDWYLEAAGDGVLTSVGAYHFEGLGIHLFSEIKGDYYTILGLPIVAVLEELRRLAVFLK
jgi:septum formation protein